MIHFCILSDIFVTIGQILQNIQMGIWGPQLKTKNAISCYLRPVMRVSLVLCVSPLCFHQCGKCLDL